MRYTEALKAIGIIEITDANCELMDAAEKIDRTRAEIVANSKRMAERFAEFGRRIGEGHMEESPTGWSSLRDIERDTAALTVRIECIFSAIRGQYGAERAKAFRKAVQS